MMTYFILALDLLLVVALYFTFRRVNRQDSILAEVTEERRLLEELRSTVVEELRSAEKSCKRHVANISRMAAEAEEALKNGDSVAKKRLAELFADIGSQLDEPLTELARRQAAVQVLLKDADRKSHSLKTQTERATNLTRFFKTEVPYEDILSELETKKFGDARRSVLAGRAVEEVAQHFGLSVAETKMLRQVSRAGSLRERIQL